MDLGFARRNRSRNNAQSGGLDLSTLLATISAQQVVSPTARALAREESGGSAQQKPQHEADHFAPSAGQRRASNASASFNADVAAAILTHRKSL